jgi:hypothetical protein
VGVSHSRFNHGLNAKKPEAEKSESDLESFRSKARAVAAPDESPARNIGGKGARLQSAPSLPGPFCDNHSHAESK